MMVSSTSQEHVVSGRFWLGQRTQFGKADQEPGRDGIQLRTCPNVNVRRNDPSVDGA